MFQSKKTVIIIQIFLFLLLIFTYSWFRIQPIISGSVGYTYDQGRDFLKAAEIVIQKNPTFIGPTTGINGVYHGAWWYYILAISFVIFQGLPIGFYFVNFVIQLVSFLIFYLFLRKSLGFLPAFFIGLIAATSPQLIFDSIFIANNVMAIPSFLLVLLTSFLILEHKYLIHVSKSVFLSVHFLLGLALGFTAEFEFAFGLLLIPSFFLILVVTQKSYKFFTKFSQLIWLFCGLVIPFLPRLFFEIKNNFSQTKTLISFIFNPSYHTPMPYANIFSERILLFKSYFNSIMLTPSIWYGIVAVTIICAVISLFRRKFDKKIWFFLLLLLSLFFASTLYKDTFWFYYFDGIQYLLILIFGLIFFSAYRSINFKNAFRLTTLLILIFLFQISLNEWKNSNKPFVYDGIRVQQDIVKYIYAQNGNKPLCVRVYTPPVIPYTYDYLFTYNNYRNKLPLPQKDFVDEKCYFIIEYDDYKERKDAWIKNEIPKDGTLLSHKKIKDVDIELWRKNEILSKVGLN